MLHLRSRILHQITINQTFEGNMKETLSVLTPLSVLGNILKRKSKTFPNDFPNCIVIYFSEYTLGVFIIGKVRAKSSK